MIRKRKKKSGKINYMFLSKCIIERKYHVLMCWAGIGEGGEGLKLNL
jgi:hypothetical protein